MEELCAVENGAGCLLGSLYNQAMPPYDVKCVQRGGKWVCISGPASDNPGKVHGTFDKKDQCEAQMRAIYANDPTRKH